MCWEVRFTIVPEHLSQSKIAEMTGGLSPLLVAEGKEEASDTGLLIGTFPDFTVGPHCACGLIKGSLERPELDALMPLLNELMKLPNLKRLEFAFFWEGKHSSPSFDPQPSCGFREFAEAVERRTIQRERLYKISAFM